MEIEKQRMSLLFEFLKNLPDAEMKQLLAKPPAGTAGMVFREMVQQAEKGEFNRARMQQKLQLSNTYFDKVSSELLSFCYRTLFPDEGLPLLRFLSMRVAYVKHYYKELGRQLRWVEHGKKRNDRSTFYKGCIDHIHFNLSIMNKDREVMKKMAVKYVASVQPAERASAQLWVNCRLIYNRIDHLFAGARIKEKSEALRKELLQKLGTPETIRDPQLLFEYYWVWIYYYLAIESFTKGVGVACEAQGQLQQFHGEAARMNVLRVQMKISELLYFDSRFEESYAMYHSVILGPMADVIPERGYYMTKYIQVCLITGHLKAAKKMLDQILKFYGKRLHETLPVRDIFSFIKYYLFAGEYDRAFEFLQLGFQRNPKGKYFQYEIELRNLQVALFFLTGREEDALQMCGRNIKYLRSHGYSVRDSNYPYFYILTRAILEQRVTGRPFKPLEEEKWERFNRGSYAVYGRLLQLMRKKNNGCK